MKQSSAPCTLSSTPTPPIYTVAVSGANCTVTRHTDYAPPVETSTQHYPPPRHVDPAEAQNDPSRREGGRIQIERKFLKKRKLNAGELVVARREGSDGAKKWEAAKVVEVVGQGSYRCAGRDICVGVAAKPIHGVGGAKPGVLSHLHLSSRVSD